jgi:hypothetical protein
LACLDLFGLTADKLFERLNKSFPFVWFFFLFGLGRQDEAIVVVKTSHVVIVEKTFSVEIAHKSIFMNNLLVHHIFIGLGNDSNQEIQKNNKHDKLVGEPNSPN